MATQVAVYAVRVKKRSAKDSFQMLDSIDNAGDLLDFVTKHMQAGAASNEHHKHESLVSASRFSRVDVRDRMVEGTLDVGQYGEACPVVDVDSSEEVFSKSERHADMMPMYFRLEVPNSRDEAVLFIQKSRRARVKTAFETMLKKPFEEKYPELLMSMELFMPAELFKKYLNIGSVQKLRFTRMSIPPDFVDSYDSGHKETKGTAEYIIKAKRNSELPVKNGLFDFLKSGKPIRDYYTVPGFDYDNVKVAVKLGNRTRNVDVGNKRSAPLWELPGLVLERNRPTFESVSAAVSELRGQLLDQLYSTPE